MSKTFLALAASLLVLLAMGWLLMRTNSQRAIHQPQSSSASHSDSNASQSDSSPLTDEVMLFCAASNQAVMEEIRREYEEATGRSIVIQYGPSQTLLSQIEVTGAGDLYLPADDSFLDLARDKGLIEEVVEIATMHCGVVVPKGNPKNIRRLADLFAEDLRLVQANPEAAAVAKLTKQVATSLGVWEQLDQATDAYRTTVNDVANDILVGAADAGIVYDAVLKPYPDLEFVAIPEFADAVSKISVAVVGSSRKAPAALHFARYVSAKDRGLIHYARHGFRPVEGDAWSDVPELTMYAGSMLRPAIEETIVEFEQREGVRVSRAYNGCGILVSQMKSGQHPDAYFACDMEFMEQVADLFPESVQVSENELVILVQKGNPKNVRTLRDLTQEGLRVGVGHEKQCAMGWITQMTFEESGMKKEIMDNVTVQSPTGDMLVNQLRTGSLDAAVAYLSNAAGAAEFLDALQIEGIPCSTASQPWAVAKESQYPQLANRLFAKICSEESQQIFAAEGFRWQWTPKAR